MRVLSGHTKDGFRLLVLVFVSWKEGVRVRVSKK